MRRRRMLSTIIFAFLRTFLISCKFSSMLLTLFGGVSFVASCLSLSVLLAWLVAIVNNESWLIDIKVGWSGWVVKVGTISIIIGNSCIYHVCWTLKSLLDLLLLAFWVYVVLNLLLGASLSLACSLLVLLQNHHVVDVWVWWMTFYFLHFLVFG